MRGYRQPFAASQNFQIGQALLLARLFLPRFAPSILADVCCDAVPTCNAGRLRPADGTAVREAHHAHHESSSVMAKGDDGRPDGKQPPGRGANRTISQHAVLMVQLSRRRTMPIISHGLWPVSHGERRRWRSWCAAVPKILFISHRPWPVSHGGRRPWKSWCVAVRGTLTGRGTRTGPCQRYRSPGSGGACRMACQQMTMP